MKIDKVKLEEQRKELRANILRSTDTHIQMVTTLQENLHKTVLLEAARYVYVYRNCDIVIDVLNKLKAQSGSQRLDAVCFWFQDIAGFQFEHNEKQGFHSARFARDEFTSENGVPFTYDRQHLDFCRQEALRFWKVAPKAKLNLKVAELDKVTQSAEVQLARALSVGAMTEDEVIEHLEGMFIRIQESMNSKGVKKWVGEYFASQPKAEEPETEIDDSLVSEM